MLGILIRGGRAIAEGPEIGIRRRNEQELKFIKLNSDGLSRIGDPVNLEPIDVISDAVGEVEGELLKIAREYLVGSGVQTHPRDTAVVRAEQSPVSRVALRESGSIVG